jgi:elongation factor G
LPNIGKAIAASKLCPVYAVSTTTLVGLATLLDHIIEFAPDPAHPRSRTRQRRKGEKESRPIFDQRTFLVLLLPHRLPIRSRAASTSSRSSVAKVGTGRDGLQLEPQHRLNVSARCTQCRASSSTKSPEANAGDIIACVKLKETQTGDTLCDKAHPIIYDPVAYPEAAIAFAIEPKSRQDEEKISVAIHKILEEDPALSFTRDAQTKEFLLAGSGPGARRNHRRQTKEAL